MLVVTAGRVLMAVILIVEEDVFIHDYAEMMIQDWDHRTLLASDVDEALSLLRSPQHIDALFTDIYLKTAGLGRCEFARQAIVLRAEVACAYTTDNSITDKMKALFVEGAHFLRKPYQQHHLQNSVEELLAG
jgi:CheY-like chemotaxis protein